MHGPDSLPPPQSAVPEGRLPTLTARDRFPTSPSPAGPDECNSDAGLVSRAGPRNCFAATSGSSCLPAGGRSFTGRSSAIRPRRWLGAPAVSTAVGGERYKPAKGGRPTRPEMADSGHSARLLAQGVPLVALAQRGGGSRGLPGRPANLGGVLRLPATVSRGGRGPRAS